MKIDYSDIAISPDLVLVKLYKPRTYKQEQKVLDEEKNKGKDPKKDILALKTVEEKVMYNMQQAIVLAIDPNNRLAYEPGDLVIVDVRKLKDFDLFKDTKLCNLYDVIGKVKTLLDD